MAINISFQIVFVVRDETDPQRFTIEYDEGGTKSYSSPERYFLYHDWNYSHFSYNTS